LEYCGEVKRAGN